MASSGKASTKKKDSAAREARATEADMPMAGDLETLRDILFGNQARATEDRLDLIERQLAATRRDLQDDYGKRLDALAEKSANQLAAAQADLSQRLDKQDASQSEQLKSAHEELSTAIKQLGDRLAEELQQNFRQMSERLDASNAELSERLLAAQEDARQRDADLRQELLTLSAWLDDKKASRHDLGQMLADIGRRLQEEGKTAADGQSK